MAYRCIRGAITVEHNDRNEILEASRRLLKEIISQNGVEQTSIISALFTATPDLTKVYPAVAARELGLIHAGLMCMQEMYVEHSLEKCIRILVNIESDASQMEMKHVYLGEAKRLRLDLIERPGQEAIAIDGPSGAGKSTVARLLAQELGYIYVDTGAMYRAFGLYCRRRGFHWDSPDEIERALEEICIDLDYYKGKQCVYLMGEDVTKELRTQENAQAASKVATIKSVRERLTEMQKDIAAKHHVVMEGRDIGSNVLPNATLKIFLTASVEERTRRRVHEFHLSGKSADFETIRKEIEQRDHIDMSRTVSPLKMGKDVVAIDASQMSADEVKEVILGIYRERLLK